MPITNDTTLRDPNGQTGISQCFPATLCYQWDRGCFVQVGQGEDAEWFDHEGNPIDREELFPVDREGSFIFGWARFRTVSVMGHFTRVSEAVDQLNRLYSPKHYATIHLASDEWGNDTMREVAEEYFRDNPDEEFVEIYEHAGWFLGFRRDGSIWNTANDTATLNDRYPQPSGHSGHVIRR